MCDSLAKVRCEVANGATLLPDGEAWLEQEVVVSEAFNDGE